MIEGQNKRVIGDPAEVGAWIYAQTKGGVEGDPPPTVVDGDPDTSSPDTEGYQQPVDGEADTATDGSTPAAAPRVGDGDPPP